jgi:hypothetical protein
LKLIKDFFENRRSSQIESYGNVLKKALTTNDQRMEAIEALKGIKDERVIAQFLKRFELVLDHGMQDTKEKNLCLEAIVSFEDAAKPYIEDALKTKKRIAWPIKIAEQLYSPEEYLKLLLKNLNSEAIVFDSDWVERQTELLLALTELSDKRITSKVLPYLTARYEEVRIAALECLKNQAYFDVDARQALIEIAKQEITDENSRFIGNVKQIIARNNWRL